MDDEALERQLKAIIASARRSENSPLGSLTLDEAVERALQLIKQDREVPKQYYNRYEVEANESNGWFYHSGIVFQVVKVGEEVRILGRLTTNSEANKTTCQNPNCVWYGREADSCDPSHKDQN